MSAVDRDTLMAYLDGQLDAPARASVEADPVAMAELSTLQRQSDAIRTLFAPTAAETVPARLDPHRIARVHARRRFGTSARAAMIVALVGIGIAAGWLLRPLADAPALHDRLIANAVSAHTVYVAESLHAVEVEGSDSAHLSTWLSNRLETDLAMPDLSADGFAFLGGRLLPAPEIAGGRAAQLMYEDTTGERLTLYITPATGVTGPAYESVGFGLDTALYWANETFTCTLVGPQSAEVMHALITSVGNQLSPGQTQRPYRDL
jgi:anti-sigma factor RsiW